MTPAEQRWIEHGETGTPRYWLGPVLGLVAAAIVLLIALCAQAQDYDTEALEARIEQLERDQRAAESQRQADQFNQDREDALEDFNRSQQRNTDQVNGYLEDLAQ